MHRPGQWELGVLDQLGAHHGAQDPLEERLARDQSEALALVLETLVFAAAAVVVGSAQRAEAIGQLPVEGSVASEVRVTLRGPVLATLRGLVLATSGEQEVVTVLGSWGGREDSLL